MSSLFLVIVIICFGVQNICSKEYNTKIKGGAFAFASASSLFSLIFFVLTSGQNFTFTSDILVYSVGFAIAYGTCVVTSVLAIQNGPLSLTSLIIQYSLIIPTFYGLAFLDEPLEVLLIVGVLLLIVSLFFINKEDSEQEKRITLKWAVFAFLAFVSNGACCTIQKVQQMNFDGNYKENLYSGDKVLIKKAMATTKIIKISEESFLEVLHSKMRD